MKISSIIEPLKKVGSVYIGICPTCSKGTLILHENKNWVCLSCGKRGDEKDLVSIARGISKKEAECLLKDIPYVPDEDKEMEDTKAKIFCMNKIAQEYFAHTLFSDAGKAAREYFKKRGLERKTIYNFQLGYADGTLCSELRKDGFSDDEIVESGLGKKDEKTGRIRDAFFRRVMFPIPDASGQIAGFGGRVLDDSIPKYLNTGATPVFNKRSLLYGLYTPGAYQAKTRFVLCEGYMDVISMYQAGVKNAVATLGTALGQQQAELIRSYTDHVLLCYDSDEPGTAAAKRAVPILAAEGIRSKRVSFDPAKDPDELLKRYGTAALSKKFREAEDGVMFCIRTEAEGLDLSKPEDRASFIEKAVKIILETGKKPYGATIYEVSKRYGVEAEALWTVLRLDNMI